MRKFKSIRSFLLGLVCLALLSVNNADAKRPIEVPKSVLKNGCLPFTNSCPSYMYCLVDIRYAYWGQCSCNGFHSKQQKPPSNNGSELAPPITKEACELVPSMGYMAWGFWLIWMFVQLRFLIGSLMVAGRVFQKGAAKLNSSYIGLISFAFHTFGTFQRGLAFMIYRGQFDPTSWFWDTNRPLHSFFETSFGYFYRYEILCSWIDLLDKSVKMSKNTSTLMKVIRTFTRLVGIATLVFATLLELQFMKGNWVSMNNFMVSMQQPFIGGTCLFIAPLLVRLLCKDMRDVTHPNWKAAAAIRRTAIGEILFQVIFPQFNRFYLKHNIWADWGGVHGESILMTMFYWLSVSDSEWLGYLLFAHRKYLQDDTDATARISNFFGFSTLGLNGTVSSQIISRVSGKSSVMTESSVDETDDNGKEEVA